MSRKLSFSAAARQLGVSVDEVRDCVVDERVVMPVRVTMAGEPIPFDFADLVIGDKVTDEGIILATVNRGGDIYKPNWVTVEAGKLMVMVDDIDVIAAHLKRGQTPGGDAMPPGPAYSMLATRDQLITAFGGFTGMNATWFRSLRDKPRLQAACKVDGRGGHGLTIEPWFCPYEVMEWLIDPKRKAGRPLAPEAGWRLFKRHFRNAYLPRSAGDPNPD